MVESTKAASDVFSPISGEVIESNEAIVSDPSSVNADPENNAWFFKIKVSNKSEMDSLMNKFRVLIDFGLWVEQGEFATVEEAGDPWHAQGHRVGE